MTSSLFNIRPNQLNNISNYLRGMKDLSWEVFDVDCKRVELQNTIQLMDILTNSLGRNKYINPECSTIHYVNYDIEGSYILDEHYDGCKQTIIIYLDKGPSIKDTFYVDNKLINNSNWKYNGFIMDGHLKHSGVFKGYGKRNILCIFMN
jgi:hypothetical protein